MPFRPPRRVLILDGYVDEPSTLGVPPTLSPYARYLFGAALDASEQMGIEMEIDYLTIVQYRKLRREHEKEQHSQLLQKEQQRQHRQREQHKNRSTVEVPDSHDRSKRGAKLNHGRSSTTSRSHSGKSHKRLSPSHSSVPVLSLKQSDILILVNHTPVPGNYLSGRPASPRELTEIAADARVRGVVVLSWKTPIEGVIHLERDADAFLYDFIIGISPEDRFRSPEEWDRWSVLGAQIITHHPDFPERLICEIDTLKGCVRYINGGCVFCTDPLERFRMRTPEAILDEIRAITEAGGKHIRLGGSCILSFLSKGIGETDRPKPDPVRLSALFRAIRELLPQDAIFHTDNANAGIMVEHPEESQAVLEAIVRYVSPGNSLSLGLESADPVVSEQNNLNARPHEVAEAVRMINLIGREPGWNGMPKLLPGLNLLYGLPGERPETHGYNLEFIRNLRKEGMLFRRINVRQLSPVRIRGERKNHHFRTWKQEIRESIDVPNLVDIIPIGTVLRGVHIETHDGGNSFGRQVGTYPILVGIPFPVDIHRQVDVRIIDHGIRSVTGIPVPLDLNTATIRELSSLPGVGRKRAARIIRKRPLSGREELAEILENEELAGSIWHFCEME